MDIVGYIGALFAGLILGLIGGGGSILTVPILVYLFSVHEITATAYSLFVVGVTSATGSIKNLKNKVIDVKAALGFAIPASLAVYLTRRLLIPYIPEHILTIGSFKLTNTIFTMVLFAVIMLLAGISMIRGRKQTPQKERSKTYNYPLMAVQASSIGLLAGLVGAGGGFLFVPALVFLVKLPMKKAVGTSLLIIALNSLIGFMGDVTTIDWSFLLTFTGLSMVGIFIGIWLSKFINGKQLKKGFGYFTLIMAIIILYLEYKKY